MVRKMKNLKALIVSLAISLGVGALSGFLAANSMELYQSLDKPPLSPPGWLFPVVWTILFILMGISAYLIYISDSPHRESALKIYTVQLAANFLWSILFFRFEMYLLAFLWLVLLWILILMMIRSFAKVNKTAAYLQIPYLIWVTFAGYLNLGVFLLNR